ncbi:MAG TPA: TVP38/TMEM64 family protein [Candidatus Enterenecus stercoripullorum]|nr:TVP38/TMEM64 family protein [Candidatus Enterenecus stercoripullorum]
MSERKRTILLWILAVLVLGAIVLALYATGFFDAISSQKKLEAYIQASTPWSHLVFFGVQLASVVLAPIPSNITAAVGGVLFGMLPAFLLTWTAVVLGSLIVFALARVLGQKFASQFVGKKLSEKYLDVIRRKQDVFLLMAFLFPFFPDDLLCILAGLSDISWKRFLALCLLARPWGLLVASAVGGSALDLPIWGMVLIGIAGIAVFVLAMKYGDRVEQAILERLKK